MTMYAGRLIVEALIETTSPLQLTGGFGGGLVGILRVAAKRLSQFF